jgi:hypothetical protein
LCRNLKFEGFAVPMKKGRLRCLRIINTRDLFCYCEHLSFNVLTEWILKALQNTVTAQFLHDEYVRNRSHLIENVVDVGFPMG